MSDRLAVFNHGRIEQVGTPGRGVRAAGDRLRRRVRRRVERAGGRGGARRSPATPGAFTIRPEKIAMRRSRTPRSGPTSASASGHVREVVYLGAVTRYIVELDVGGELVVMQQNLTDVVDGGAAGPGQGRAAGVGAEATTARSRTAGGALEGSMRTQEEGASMRKQLRWFGRRRECSMLVAAACSSDGGERAGGDGGGGGGDTMRRRRLDSIGEGEGAAQPDRLERVHRGRLDRPYGVRLGDAVRGRDRLQVNVKYADTSDEMVTADAAGRRHRVRRRVGLRRRIEPADRRTGCRRDRPGLFPESRT